MTEAEMTNVAAQLEAADTEIAALEQKILESISAARVHNRARKVFEDERDAIRAKVQPLREAAARHIQEVKRQQAEKAKAEAEARAAAEAAKPKEPTNAELLAKIQELTNAELLAKIQELTAKLEAKS
jgi:hypothetical protein